MQKDLLNSKSLGKKALEGFGVPSIKKEKDWERY